jgi:hypothetical protein
MRLRNSIVEIPCHQDLDPETMTRMAKVVRQVLVAARQPEPKRARG